MEPHNLCSGADFPQYDFRVFVIDNMKSIKLKVTFNPATSIRSKIDNAINTLIKCTRTINWKIAKFNLPSNSICALNGKFDFCFRGKFLKINRAQVCQYRYKICLPFFSSPSPIHDFDGRYQKMRRQKN